MNPTHAPLLIQWASDVLQNDISKAVSLLKIVNKCGNSRGDPLEEADRRDFMLWLYSKTEHCEDSMQQLISKEDSEEAISEQEPDQTQLVA